MNFILDASAEGVTDLDSLVLTRELFTNYDESESKFSDGTVITVKLAGGNTVTTTIGALQVIPEPATATLSLMALCALAARRRRAVR
ncbi:MAG: PEP-CTERM sorting domain-containing protein, partial [Akkermansia sp.]|nr:PEP-CTERM sorting domain-containing protein [Akkermansia sp.]